MKKLLGFIVLFGLLFSACRKDDIQTNTTSNPPGPTIKVEAEVYGLVIDEDENIVEDATIQLGAQTTTTDENGYFRISGFAAEGHGVLKVSKSGYYDAFPVFRANEQRKQYSKVQMIQRTVSGLVQASSGGVVSVSAGGAVDFAANSFVDESGNTYSGDVNVYMHYLDPTKEDIDEFMPGNLLATDANNNSTLLTSLGMLNVELEGSAGQKLNISSPATMRIPVPSSLNSIAPNTIPLWHFDTETGLWIEEGSATLSAGVYEGTVEHFTFWNCDIPNDYVCLTGRIVFEGTTPLVTVRVTAITSGDNRSSYTDVDGYFEGKVPNDVDLLLEVLDECGAVMHTVNLGSLTSNTDVGTIFLLDNTSYVHLRGTLKDCDNNAVQNGYVLYSTNLSASSGIVDVTNGSFNTSISVCDATQVSVIGYDLDALEFGTAQNFPVQDTIDVGDLLACGNLIIDGVDIETQNGSPIRHHGCSLGIDTASNGGGFVYYFDFVDDQGNGNKVLYEFVIIDWAGDPNDPQFTYAISWQAIGSLDQHYVFSGGDINFVQYANNFGDYGIVEILNAGFDIVDGAGNIVESHPGTTITLTGLYQ